MNIQEYFSTEIVELRIISSKSHCIIKEQNLQIDTILQKTFNLIYTEGDYFPAQE